MKADVSIKWSERAADCPLVEEKSCGLCFWTKPRGLSMTGTLQSEALWWWRAPLCFMFTSDWSSFRAAALRSTSQPFSLAVCLCLKSGAVSDFHADVWLEQAGDFWGFLMNQSLLVCGFKHQSKAATWVQLREDSVKTATPTGHLLWPHVIMPLLFYSSLSFLVHGQQTSL